MPRKFPFSISICWQDIREDYPVLKDKVEELEKRIATLEEQVKKNG